MKTTKKRNFIIMILLVICLIVWAGVYFYRTQATLTHYQSTIPTNDALQNISLNSGGSDVNLTFANTGASEINLAGDVTPAFIKQNEIIQKEATALHLNFNNSQGHRLFNSKKASTHAIDVTIPISAAIKLKTVIINTHSGDIRLVNVNQLRALKINTNGGDVYLSDQDALTFNHKFTTSGGDNDFADSGRGNVNNGGTLAITTNGGDIIRSK